MSLVVVVEDIFDRVSQGSRQVLQLSVMGTVGLYFLDSSLE